MNRNARSIVLVILACCVAGLVYGLVRSMRDGGGTDMTTFRRNAADSSRAACFRTARAGAPASVADAKITDYCACATDGMMSTVTDEEARAVDRGGAVTPEMAAKMSAAAQACQGHLAP